MADFTLILDPPQCGILIAHVIADGRAEDMFTSYIHDGMRDMACEVLALVNGAPRVTFSWLDEPGEYRWIIERRRPKGQEPEQGGEDVQVRVLWFSDGPSNKPDEAGEVLIECDCSLVRFASQVRGQLQQLLNKCGEQGYREEWRYPFPAREHAALTARLGELKRQRRERSA